MTDAASAFNRHVTDHDDDSALDSTPAVLDPELANLGGPYLDYNDADFDITGLLDPQMDANTFQYLSQPSSALIRRPTSLTNNANQDRHSSSPPIPSISRSPTRSIRLLIPRPNMSIGQRRIANLILHTLKSYPLIMLHHNTLPPFIHPSLKSPNLKTDKIEPLTNCISLVHMISSGVRGSRQLFWRDVQLECEHICEDVSILCLRRLQKSAFKELIRSTI
jgi:hypothetical protein